VTRKDYILIAAALRDTRLINVTSAEFLNGARAARISVAHRLADALARDNPRFDCERFFR
jgi:hypothetical protein